MRSLRKKLAPVLCICMMANLTLPAYGSSLPPLQIRDSTQVSAGLDTGKNSLNQQVSDSYETSRKTVATASNALPATNSNAAPAKLLSEEEIPIEKITLTDMDGNPLSGTIYLNLDDGETLQFRVEVTPENATEGWYFKQTGSAEGGDFNEITIEPCDDNSFLITPKKLGGRVFTLWPDSVHWENHPSIAGLSVQVQRYWHIVLDGNGGSFDDGADTYTLTKVTYKEFNLDGIIPVRDGYKFSGNWYNWPECVGAPGWTGGSSYSIDSDRDTLTRTLYAGWIELSRLENAAIELTEDHFTYTGEPIIPEVTVTDPDGHVLTEGTDYTVAIDPAYGGNIDAGTAAVLIQAVPGSDYAGEQSKTFTIEKAELDIELPEEPLKAVYGQTLSDVSLPEGWEWARPEESVGTVGESHKFTAWYRAEDSKNYNDKKVSLSVTVVPYSLEGAELRIEKEDSFVYTGEEFRPAVSVWIDGTEIPSEVYRLEYKDNVNAGTATVTAVAAGGNYSDSVSGTFTIEPADAKLLLQEKSFSGEYGTRLSEITLPGGWSWQNPDFFVGDVTSDGRTFHAEYDAAANNGNYKSETGAEITVTVTSRSIKAAEIKAVLDQESYLLTGTPITPVVAITDSIFGTDVTLKESSDYTVTYSDNDKEGTGRVIVTGIGNYTDTLELPFEIKMAPYDIALAEIHLNPEKAVYTGEAIEPDVTVILGDTTLQSGKDYTLTYSNNVNPGFGTVTVTGTGSEGTFTYYNEQTVSFYIAPGNWQLEEAIYGSRLSEVKLPEGWTWQNPESFVGNVSETGNSFEAVYSSADGQLEETAEFTVKVLPENINDTGRITISVEKENLSYDNGNRVRPTISITDGMLEKTLTENVDYKWTTENDTAAGTALLTIEGTGNYTGSFSDTYEISKAENHLEISADKLADSVLRMIIGQNPVFLNIDYLGDGELSLKSESETVALSETAADASGKLGGKVTAVGLGETSVTVSVAESQNYKAVSRTITVIVEPVSLTDAAILLSGEPFVYTGSQIKPDVTVAIGDLVLTKDRDYTVEFGENIHAGEHAGSVTITGIGNYCGSAETNFTIEKAVNPAVLSDTELNAVYGQKQAELSLEDGWLWRTPQNRVGDAGKHELEVYLPETRDYLEKSWTVSVDVAPKALEETMVSMKASSFVYDGTPKQPELHVADGTLMTEKDYEISYENHVHAGTGTVTVTGIRNYKGTMTNHFTIGKATPELTVGAGTSVTKNVSEETFSLEAVLSNGGSLIYSSSDDTVAAVDENGTVTMYSTGTAEISIVYEGNDDYEPAAVTVVLTVKQLPENNRDDSSDDSGDSDDSASEYWSMKPNGVWNYYDKSGTLVKGRWMLIYNPYANTALGQSAYDWFRFDENGTMVTGWYQDKENDFYYLNPISDNTKGRMVTGWQMIDGVYYYFNEKSDGKKGRLLRNTITPDGFRVDETGARQEKATR